MNNRFVHTRNRSWNEIVYWNCEPHDECHGRINVKMIKSQNEKITPMHHAP